MPLGAVRARQGKGKRMGIRACAAFAAAMAAMACAPQASAQEGRGITGPEMVAILQEQGYRARLGSDEEGDPKIDTAMNGVNATVFFYDCDDGRCGALQFRCGLDLERGWSLEALNAFNREYRYVNAWLDDERDPFLEFDFEVLHARQAEHVASQVELWVELLDNFLVDTGFRGAAGDAGGEDQQ